MLILHANLIIIFITNKYFMVNLDARGISSYYKDLPRGTKDQFIREVADAISQSTTNVGLKMRNGRWSQLEINAINRVIDSRR